jgi:hypothetical protein
MEDNRPISSSGSNKRSTSYSTAASYSNSIGKERRYVPTHLCVTAHSAYLTSFLSSFRQISFNHNNAQMEKMLPLHNIGSSLC